MHTISIFLALASVALINAAAIPADPQYDTCIAQYGTIFATEPTPEIAKCSGCAGKALAAGITAYGGNTANTVIAQAAYAKEMTACRGATTDETFDTCLARYATIFAGAPSPTIADCSGCMGKALAAGIQEYKGDQASVERAKAAYTASMAACRAAA